MAQKPVSLRLIEARLAAALVRAEQLIEIEQRYAAMIAELCRERAPTHAGDKNGVSMIKRLREERDRYQKELENIVNANYKDFADGEEFRVWAKSRAARTLAKLEAAAKEGK